MLKRFFSRPAPRLSDAISEEVQSICRAHQVEALSLPRHLRKDLGIDCGCGDVKRW